jgi:DNA-binding NarL/FixJ family response regulator
LAEVPSGSPVRLLIVDDHDLLASSLQLALSRAPDVEPVGRATTVAEACRMTRSSRPDVVVLDYRLPDGDGVTAIPQLRAAHPGVKVVILTASDSEQLLASAVEAGCSGFVLKAEPLEELLAAVRAAAAGEVNISPMLLARLLPRIRRGAPALGGDLSPRELDVLNLLAEGLANSAIAERLGISIYTVRNHVQAILAKLGVHSKLEALATAVREGLLPTDRP